MSGVRDRGQNGTGLGTRGSLCLTLLFLVRSLVLASSCLSWKCGVL